MLKLDKFMIGRKTMENKMLDDPNRKYVPKKEFITYSVSALGQGMICDNVVVYIRFLLECASSNTYIRIAFNVFGKNMGRNQ